MQWLVCWTSDLKDGVQISARTEIWYEISARSAALANSVMMNTLTVHCRWKGEMAKERTDHLTSYAMAKRVTVYSRQVLADRLEYQLYRSVQS